MTNSGCTKKPGKDIREDFPILHRKVHDHRLIYLDNAATTQRPRSVIESVKSFYEQTNANIHRAVHILSYEATVAYELAHKKVAQFIRAKSWREIIFVRNTTEGLNLLAYALGLWHLKEGDAVVITLMEHHSNIVPWQMLRRLKGIKLYFTRVTKDGLIDLDHYMELIEKPEVKVVSMTMASNVLGTVTPFQEMVHEARKRGKITILDGAQAVPHIPVDVQAIGCDALVASGHKMLGPTGIGFVYARRSFLEELEPFLYGGDMIETVTTETATWNELPWKFEAGTPNIAGGVAMSAAIDYLQDIGMDAVYEHEKELLEYALEHLRDIPGIHMYGPEEGPRLGVLSFTMDKAHPHDIAHILDEHGIAVRSGHHCAQPLMNFLGMDNAVRASFYIYNDKDDVDALVEALKKVVKIFRIA